MRKVGFYCPRCKTLIDNKTYKDAKDKYLISCECHPFGAHLCLNIDKELIGGIDWYKLTKELQKHWKPVFVKE